MRTLDCNEARAHVSDALAGEISRPDAGVLESHLLECDACRQLAELFVWQDRVISELAAQARMEQLCARVRHGLEHLDQVAVAEDGPKFTLVIPWKKIAVAAAAIFALIFVLTNRKPAVEPVAVKVEAPPAVQPEPLPLPEPQETATVKEETPPLVPDPAPKPEVVVAPMPMPLPKKIDAVVKQPPPPPPAPPVPPPAPVVSNAGKEVVAPAPRPKTLDEAVRGGMAFLKAKAALLAKETRNDELLLWTYLQGGLGENEPEFQALLRPALEKKLEKTYNVALLAMTLEELDRVKHQKRIAQCAQFLLDNQCANGQWGYGDPSIFAEEFQLPPIPKGKTLRKIALTRKRDGPAAGDNSNTMYALLGLRACFDAGVTLPVSSMELAAKWWRDTQSRTAGVKGLSPEGWCYCRNDAHKPYGSMTAGGVGSLVICDYLLGRDWKKDREVANGMEWLSKNFSVSYNPGPYEHANFELNSQHQFYYYMYALERAAILYGTEQIGPNVWFAKGLQVMIEQQRPDGSWKAAVGGSELMDTCFAVLFLRKATRALVDVPTPGAGSKK